MTEQCSLQGMANDESEHLPNPSSVLLLQLRELSVHAARRTLDGLVRDVTDVLIAASQDRHLGRHTAPCCSRSWYRPVLTWTYVAGRLVNARPSQNQRPRMYTGPDGDGIKGNIRIEFGSSGTAFAQAGS